jgi:Ser/Thr protein kinase RdoA (MazF antagonist)
MSSTHSDGTEYTLLMDALATEAALEHYALGPVQLEFIDHNAGRVYRASTRDNGQSFLLKLHLRVGEGANASPERLELGMQWLAGIARETTLVVQTPIASRDATFVSIVEFEGKSICCTLQQWIDGSPPIGVTLYHTFHQGRAARLAFLDGYNDNVGFLT